MTYLEHLREYERIDICLDTFPFNGHTTTCDAFWMGVPIISLYGASFASRLGLSLLRSVGLEFFAAGTAEEYVAKATALAKNHQSLVKIRASMRERMLSCGLCNAKRLALGVEDAYRKMWHRWCKARGTEMSDKDTRLTQSRERQERPLESVKSAIATRQPEAKRGIIYMIWGDDEKHQKTLSAPSPPFESIILSFLYTLNDLAPGAR